MLELVCSPSNLPQISSVFQWLGPGLLPACNMENDNIDAFVHLIIFRFSKRKAASSELCWESAVHFIFILIGTHDYRPSTATVWYFSSKNPLYHSFGNGKVLVVTICLRQLGHLLSFFCCANIFREKFKFCSIISRFRIRSSRWSSIHGVEKKMHKNPQCFNDIRPDFRGSQTNKNFFGWEKKECSLLGALLSVAAAGNDDLHILTGYSLCVAIKSREKK